MTTTRFDPPALPAPEFVNLDPAQIEADLIKRYEAASGKTLYPAQIERLLINQIAYAHGLALNAIQLTAEKMLVRRSSGVILDYLGDLVGTPRLLAKPAQCKIHFARKVVETEEGAAPAPLQTITIPAGTKVATSDAKVVFTTEAEAVIYADNLAGVIVTARCSEVGERGNGFTVGQIKALQAQLPLQAKNVTVSTGGAEIESDAHYQARIIAAPESYTNAGSYGAYRFHALSAHQSIVDVTVHGATEHQQAGVVIVYPLVENGLPSETILATVLQKLSADTVRPLCDTVKVAAPEVVDYEIVADLIFYALANRADTLAAARAALDAYLKQRQQQLGADIVPEQIAAVLQVAGIYRVQIQQPALQVIASHQWARCRGIALVDAGAEHG